MGNLNKPDPCVGGKIANLPRGFGRATLNLPERQDDCNEVPDGLFNFFAWILEGIPDFSIRPVLSDATQEETDDAFWTWDLQDWWYSPWAFGSATAYVDPEPEEDQPMLPESDEIFADFIWDDWFLANGLSDEDTTSINLETFMDEGARALYVVESDTPPSISVVTGETEYNLVIQESDHGHCLTIVQHNSTGDATTPGEYSELRFTWPHAQREVLAQVWSSTWPFDDGPDGLIEDFLWHSSNRPSVEAKAGNVELSWNEPETTPVQPLDWQLGCLLLRGNQEPHHRQYWVGIETSFNGDLNTHIAVGVYEVGWHLEEVNDPEPGDPCGLEPGSAATGPAQCVLNSYQDVEILATAEVSGEDIEDNSWSQPACGTVLPYQWGYHGLCVVYKITGPDPELTVLNSFSGGNIIGSTVRFRANEEINEVDIEIDSDGFIETFWNGNSVPDETYNVTSSGSVSYQANRRDAVLFSGIGAWRGDDPDIQASYSNSQDFIHNSGAAFVPFMSATFQTTFLVRLTLVDP